ncbi:MAG: hypothetical protein HY683_02475 [Chloroflexi bacterium]|nr:hypothetical protein [Chloroflexota bacterium]
MATGRADPLARKAYADSLVQRTAEELGRLVAELATTLDSFPSFARLSTVQALEVELVGLQDKERGCVVVCPDGLLYELTIQMIPAAPDIGGVDQVEEFKELELSAADYIPYAYAAVKALADLHLEREKRGLTR